MKICDLIERAEKVGCVLEYVPDSEFWPYSYVPFSLRYGRRAIRFSDPGYIRPVNESNFDEAVNVLRKSELPPPICTVVEMMDDEKVESVGIHLWLSGRDSAAVEGLFRKVRVHDSWRSVEFDIAGYGKGTPSVRLRTLWDSGRKVIDEQVRVLSDPGGVSLAYLKRDITVGMMLDWIWDEGKF